jgi:hypothetical protein
LPDKFLAPHRQPTALRPFGATPARAVVVRGLARPIEVKIAANVFEWRQAFKLVADQYQARGYDHLQGRNFRFTAYQALPDAATFVAKHDGRVMATLSIVLDNHLLGLPMERIYAAEIKELRQSGRRLAEITSLADGGLTRQEFLPVLVALMRFVGQYALGQDVDTLVITVNPRHRSFYHKAVGFMPFGPRRACPAVCNHPAEALLLSLALLRDNAPEMYRQLCGECLPPDALAAPHMPPDLLRYFASHSSQTRPAIVEAVLRHVRERGNPRRW